MPILPYVLPRANKTPPAGHEPPAPKESGHGGLERNGQEEILRILADGVKSLGWRNVFILLGVWILGKWDLELGEEGGSRILLIFVLVWWYSFSFSFSLFFRVSRP